MNSKNLIISFESPVYFSDSGKPTVAFWYKFSPSEVDKSMVLWNELNKRLLKAQSLFLELDYSPELMLFAPLLADTILPDKLRFLF